ncbi:MAG: hypothetical protein WKF30_07655 [Pyrinomonadaceae bacterium]
MEKPRCFVGQSGDARGVRAPVLFEGVNRLGDLQKDVLYYFLIFSELCSGNSHIYLSEKFGI